MLNHDQQLPLSEPARRDGADALQGLPGEHSGDHWPPVQRFLAFRHLPQTDELAIFTSCGYLGRARTPGQLWSFVRLLLLEEPDEAALRTLSGVPHWPLPGRAAVTSSPAPRRQGRQAQGLLSLEDLDL